MASYPNYVYYIKDESTIVILEESSEYESVYQTPYTDNTSGIKIEYVQESSLPSNPDDQLGISNDLFMAVVEYVMYMKYRLEDPRRAHEHLVEFFRWVANDRRNKYGRPAVVKPNKLYSIR